MAKTQVVEEKEKFITNPGSHYKQDIKYKFDVKVNGMVPYLGEKYDAYSKIQLAKSQVDLDMIIKRAKAGDTSVLNVNLAHYGDISDIPNNLNDLNDLYHGIEDNFDKLSQPIKDLFGNNIDVFASAVADGSYQDKISNYVKNLKDDSKKEVTENV